MHICLVVYCVLRYSNLNYSEFKKTAQKQMHGIKIQNFYNPVDHTGRYVELLHLAAV